LYYPRISNKGLLEECDKEQNVAVTGAAATSCLIRMLWNFLFNFTYSPSHRQAGTRVMNIQSIPHKAPDLYKNVSLAVLIGSNGNSHTVSTPSDICI